MQTNTWHIGGVRRPARLVGRAAVWDGDTCLDEREGKED